MLMMTESLHQHILSVIAKNLNTKVCGKNKLRQSHIHIGRNQPNAAVLTEATDERSAELLLIYIDNGDIVFNRGYLSDSPNTRRYSLADPALDLNTITEVYHRDTGYKVLKMPPRDPRGRFITKLRH